MLRRIPILFEDHTLARFRPLAYSTPVFELRCGMFNLRERVQLALQPADPGGALLCRDHLAELNCAQSWQAGPEDMGALHKAGEARFVWLNGRLAPCHELLSLLLDAAQNTSDFILADDSGLLAASLDGRQSTEMWQSWQKWASGLSGDSHTLPDWPIANMTNLMSQTGRIGSYQLWGADNTFLEKLNGLHTSCSAWAFHWIWDLVPTVGPAIVHDLAAVTDQVSFTREPFGVFADETDPAPKWGRPSRLTQWTEPTDPQGKQPWGIIGPADLWLGQDVTIAPGVVFDTTSGPVILDRNCCLQPHCYLEGPLYLGPDSTVKAGAKIYGESAFGLVNRIAGEIGESQFGDFSNKQHDGFIGHAVLGSWVNLGAMTTCSDLKNNYGNVRVDLGQGQVDTGLRFVGLLMGDHAKTAIGTLFNTGTSVGFATNIFGGLMPPKHVGNFRWGGQADCPLYAVDRAVETAAVVMSRRGCRFVEAHKFLFEALSD